MSSGSSDTRRLGEATIASSSERQFVAMRAIVCSSNRSVAYSKSALSPSAVSCTCSVRSTIATPGSTSSGLSVRPGSSSGRSGAFCKANITWTTGLRLRSRAGRSSSTSRSKGRSWCAKASRHTSRMWPRNSFADGSPDRSARSTRVLTKKPTTSSISARLRLATGVPTRRSC